MLELAHACAGAAELPRDAVGFDPTALAGGLQRCVPDAGRVQELAPALQPTSLADGLSALRDWVTWMLADA